MSRAWRMGLLSVACLAATIVPGDASAAATQVTITCSDPTGLVLDQPGVYALASAVTDCLSDTAIEITASDVTLDLKGRLVEGVDANGSIGIDVLAGANRVIVRNGAVRDFDFGVVLRANKGKASGLTVSSSDFDGISVLGTGNAVVGNTLSANETIGISTDSGNTIRNNNVTGVHDGVAFVEVGILIFGSGNTVSGNRVSANSLAGIFTNGAAATGNLISENVVVGPLGSGIDTNFASNQRIVGNRVTGAGGHGIFGLGSNRVRDNITRNNGAHGINLTLTQNKVIGNRSSGNRGDGIRVINDVTTKVRRNVANGNGALGIRAGAALIGNGSTDNRAKGNGDPMQCDPQQICD